ncbi:unnamed protein product [Parnassius apollo]|uniref:(apollo) hypothetical protein n=1 Tax=Parnassius apollo TaxID=110799 RepID=A0A8S3XRU8_PARAO|nr:unnamed protein product [Parnassius apollo]
MGETCTNNIDLSNGIKNWNKDEKFELLQALKLYSCSDVEKLSKHITTKSPEEVNVAIAYYKKKIMKDPILCQKIKKEKKRNRTNFIPLADWAKLLTDSLSFKELHTETATALRIIADFEDFPPAVCTNSIDFSKIYHALANALEGKALPKDKGVVAFLEKCLVDTALTSKAFIRQSSCKNIIKSINMSDRAVNSFPRPTDNQELVHIRHLASQRSYNPFNISEDFLKPCQ